MKLRARVNVSEKGQTHNLIILQRGEKVAEMGCVHTAIYTATGQRVFDLSREHLKELATSTRSIPIVLPPWEHFVALKSFVSGLAAIGLVNCLAELNPLFQTKFIRTLSSFELDLMFPFLDTYIADLLGRIPLEWFVDHWPEMDEVYPLSQFFNNPAFLASLTRESRKKLRKLQEIIEERD